MPQTLLLQDEGGPIASVDATMLSRAADELVDLLEEHGDDRQTGTTLLLQDSNGEPIASVAVTSTIAAAVDEIVAMLASKA